MMQIRLNDRGIYEARWTDHVDGKPRSMRKSLRTPLREDAERQLVALMNGEDPEHRQMTVPEAVKTYIEQRLAPRGQDRNVSGACVEAIARFFATTPVLRVTDDTILAFTKFRQKSVQPQTVRKELNTLQAALNFVVNKGIVRNCRNFNLPKPPDGPPRDLWLTEAQEQRLLDALESQPLDVQIFARLALTYGVRKQAIMDLTWTRVDFDREQIDFNRPGALITRKRRPKVPMTRAIRALLERKRAMGGLSVMVPETPVHYGKFAASIGLGWATPHILKHSAVTLMLRAGISMETVAALTATDIRTLAKTYRHHCKDELIAAAERGRT